MCVQVATVCTARGQILAMLRRKRNKQASKKSLVATPLRCSSLGWHFHLLDMHGKGLLDRIVHGNNVMFRIANH
jgi:hypothetical protein